MNKLALLFFFIFALLTGTDNCSAAFYSQPTKADIKTFFEACKSEDEDLVKNLLQQNPLFAQTPDSTGLYPLHALAAHAITNQKAKAIAQLLLNKGAHVNAKDSKNLTPLDYAKKQNPQLESFLKSKGGQEGYLIKPGKPGNTTPSGKQNIDPHLFNDFTNAIKQGLNAKVKTMLNQHPDLINAVDQFGNSAAHIAAQENNAEALQALFDAGANLNLQNIQGQTPLHTATTNNNANAIQKLLDLGASKDIKDLIGKRAQDITNNTTIKNLFSKKSRSNSNPNPTPQPKPTPTPKPAPKPNNQPHQTPDVSNTPEQNPLPNTPNSTQSNSGNSNSQGAINQPNPPPIDPNFPNRIDSTTPHSSPPYSKSSYVPQNMRTKPFLLAATFIADLVCIKYTHDDWNDTQKQIKIELPEGKDNPSFSEKITLYLKRVFYEPLDHQAFFALLLSLGGTGYVLIKG